MNIGILVYPSIRAIEYLKVIKREGIYLSKAIMMGNSQNEEELLKSMNIPIKKVPSRNINCDWLYETLKKTPEEIFIFTGGGIVPKKLLDLKKFIHIHPGITPEYRGSTCFYYSILNDSNIGMTGMFLSEKLDLGEVLIQKVYDLPKDIDIDNKVDPKLRAETLVELLKNNKLITYKQKNNNKLYYIIHPVLKHIAILKVNNNIKNIT